MATKQTIGSIDTNSNTGIALGQQGTNIIIVDIVSPTIPIQDSADTVPAIISAYYQHDRTIENPAPQFSVPVWVNNAGFKTCISRPSLLPAGPDTYPSASCFAVLVRKTVYVAFITDSGRQAIAYTPASDTDTIYVNFDGASLIVYYSH